MEPPDEYVGVLHVIFYQSWTDISGVAKMLSAKCETFLACEHEPDEKVQHAHVHCLLHNFDSLNEIPVEGVRTFIPKEFKGRGQYVIMKKTEKKPRVFYKIEPLSIYMIKGNVDCVRFVKNYSPVGLEELASQWIDHSAQVEDQPKTKERTHWDIIQEIVNDIEPESKTIQVGSKLLTSKRVSYDEVWSKTLKHLNKNKIKTCNQDLERWLVSVMRVTQCDDLRENLKSQMFKKLFSRF